MRVPVSWLRDYVNITLPVAELAEMLTIAGLEVEGIDYIGIAGGDDPQTTRLGPRNHLSWAAFWKWRSTRTPTGWCWRRSITAPRNRK